MTWRREIADGIHRSGSCKHAIKAGEIYAETRTHLIRCEACARKIEAPPAVIEEGAPTGVPSGIKHQASLGFESAGSMAGRHLANHLRVRSDR